MVRNRGYHARESKKQKRHNRFPPIQYRDHYISDDDLIVIVSQRRTKSIPQWKRADEVMEISDRIFGGTYYCVGDDHG